MNRLEQNELMAEYRPALTPSGKMGLEVEIFLFDTLPGGAGFSRQIVGIIDKVFNNALKILSECPGDCIRSCYRCLRSFSNKLEHNLLDRAIGKELLEFIITGKLPNLDCNRVQNSTTLLYEDLTRQGLQDYTILKNNIIKVENYGEVMVPIQIQKDGKTKMIVGLGEPLCVDIYCDSILNDLKEYSSLPLFKPINELIIRDSLPNATKDIIENLLNTQ